MGLEGYDLIKGLDCGLEIFKATLESTKRYCSRMMDRCTYIAIRSTVDRALCAAADVTPLKTKVPPTTLMESSSGENNVAVVRHGI